MDLSRTRLVAGIAAAALPLAFLAGCGEDEPEPKFEEPTSESPSASESATPDEPVKPTPPAAMKGDDVAGAKAFVKYYFAAATYSIQTGDTAFTRGLALPDCASCRGMLRTVQDIHEKGGSVSGGEWQAANIRMGKKDTPTSDFSAYGGRLVLQIAKQVVRGTGDKTLDGSSDPVKAKLQVQVVHSKSGWALAEWSPLP